MYVPYPGNLAVMITHDTGLGSDVRDSRALTVFAYDQALIALPNAFTPGALKIGWQQTHLKSPAVKPRKLFSGQDSLMYKRALFLQNRNQCRLVFPRADRR